MRVDTIVHVSSVHIHQVSGVVPLASFSSSGMGGTPSFAEAKLTSSLVVLEATPWPSLASLFLLTPVSRKPLSPPFSLLFWFQFLYL